MRPNSIMLIALMWPWYLSLLSSLARAQARPACMDMPRQAGVGGDFNAAASKKSSGWVSGGIIKREGGRTS